MLYATGAQRKMYVQPLKLSSMEEQEVWIVPSCTASASVSRFFVKGKKFIVRIVAADRLRNGAADQSEADKADFY